jgi:hypothetical protein
MLAWDVYRIGVMSTKRPTTRVHRVLAVRLQMLASDREYRYHVTCNLFRSQSEVLRPAGLVSTANPPRGKDPEPRWREALVPADRTHALVRHGPGI